MKSEGADGVDYGTRTTDFDEEDSHVELGVKDEEDSRRNPGVNRRRRLPSELGRDAELTN